MPDWKWTQAPDIGDVPTARSSHSLTNVQGGLFVFGGEHVPRTPLPNDTFRYDLSEQRWTRLQVSGDAPCGRVGHAAAAIGDTVYVFGGRTGKDFGDSSLDELHALDTLTGRWSLVAASGNVPQPRSYHSGVSANGSLYVFGGCGAGGRLNQLHRFDPGSGTWEQLPSSDAVPARGGAGFVATDGTMYVIGGFNGNELADMHAFDTKAGAWREVDLAAAPQRLPSRSVCGVAASAGALLLFGGEVEPTDLGHEAAGSYSDALWGLDSAHADRGWLKLEGVEGAAPSPRGWFPAAALPDGGFALHGGNAPDNSRLGDLHMLRPAAA